MVDTQPGLWTVQGIHLSGDTRPRLKVDHLDIMAGRTAVLGPSGAGKTTLLNLLVGFESPHHGRIETRLPTDTGRLPLFWIPPDGGLWPQATVDEHLQAVAPHGPQSSQDTLAQFGLDHLQNTCPGQLSAGERSRLSVARGLAANAGVLVADEPLVHVDPARLDRDWESLVSGTRQAGTSLVFATHLPSQALRHADRVVVLSDGQVIAEGHMAKLYTHPPSREVAESLGPANWFELEDAIAWAVGEEHTCLRPEQVVLEADPSGPARIVGSHDIGAFRETRLELIDRARGRTILHLADSAPPPSDLRVKITRRIFAE